MTGRGGRYLFSEGYRIFFLCAGVYGALAVAAWMWMFDAQMSAAGALQTPFAPAPRLWHAHEMIFGYASAAIGGFFLTAVPNWTGARAARHVFILAVSGVWLAGRLAIWWSAYLDPLAVAILDLVFLPVLAAKIATQLVKRPKLRNVMFLGLLTIVWTGNLLVHLEWTGLIGDGVDRGLRTGLYGLAALIAVLGGRVTPAFTRNAMTRSGIERRLPDSPRAATAVGVATAIMLPLLITARASEEAIGTVALIAGVAGIVRLAGWRTAWTLAQPILWSLHLAYAMLTAGYVLLGLALFGVGAEIAALHVTGIGAVGGMTLAVMSRAILGHSGRALIAPWPIASAYGAAALAAVVRATGASGEAGWYVASVMLSGALWIAAFGTFVAVFLPILLAPRASD